MKVLLVIDYINEIVNEQGKLSGKGYFDFIQKHNTFKKVNELIAKFRAASQPVIFVKLGFKPGYENQPKSSPVFGKADEFKILVEDTWSTELHPEINVESVDRILTKSRVSAFHNTELARILRELEVNEVYISAVATDLAGEAAARAAHDQDFSVTVVSDACAAANESDHEKSLNFLQKIGKVQNVAEVAV